MDSKLQWSGQKEVRTTTHAPPQPGLTLKMSAGVATGTVTNDAITAIGWAILRVTVVVREETQDRRPVVDKGPALVKDADLLQEEGKVKSDTDAHQDEASLQCVAVEVP